MAITLILSGIIISTLTAGANIIVFDWSWATYSGFFFFQPTRIPIYAGLFALGIFAGSKGWFVNQKLSGKPWLWGIISSILMILLIMCMGALFKTLGTGPMNPAPFGISVIHGFIRTFLCISAIGFSITLTEKYWNKPTRIIDSMSGVSYEIYLLHLPILVILQYLVLALALPNGITFFIVLSGSLLICYSIGRNLYKPHPRWAVAAALVVFISVALTVN